MNKIWNATRFRWRAKDFQVAAGSVDELPDRNALSDADKWIIFKLGRCEAAVNEALAQLRFSEAAQAVYDFAWHEFCDWYLEFIKPIVYGDNASEKTATQFVLAQTLNRLIRLLHPFIPFITEEIYQKSLLAVAVNH